MKYMLLVHHDEDAIAALGEPELQQMRSESVQLAHAIYADGHYVDAAPLYSASTGKCVRLHQGQRLITDGPFAETREQLGGYFLINARGLDEALSIAARVPGARIGTVEVRPVMELEGLPKR